MQQGYTGPEVCKITGISYRQLDHWTSTGLINASIRNIKGSGFQRLYSFNDIVLVKLVNKLRDAGISLQKIRVALENVSKLLGKKKNVTDVSIFSCLLYTSDAAADSLRVDLGGRRIIK